MTSDERETAEENYRARLWAIRKFAETGGYVDSHEEFAERATALGQNILHEELGYFGNLDFDSYRLDENKRDRLIAHSRQDIAATHSLASYNAVRRRAEEKHKNARLLRYIIVFSGINTVLCLIIFLNI